MRLADKRLVVLVADETCHGKHCLAATIDKAAGDVSADDFDAVVVPGGWAPDKLRRVAAVTGLFRADQ